MRKTVRGRLAATLCLLVPGATTALVAQSGIADLVQGVHIVRPGETLERLATVYLGSAREWRRLHRLNPEIANPDLIEPGQRITVVIRRDLVPAALVDRLSRRVDEQAAPIPWTDAKIGDLLVERDGLRTYRRSSAEVRVTDGTRLTVTEDSLVFLRRAGRTLSGVEAKSVEIVEGQADLAARFGPAPARPEVELILGAARSTARPDAAGTVETRARRPGEGGAKVMVYGGESEVESAGAKVTVASGMGTSVPEQGPPSPPEKLLAAPLPTSPPAEEVTPCATPLFVWSAVPEAASYTLEVCRDPGCGELIERLTGLAESSWRPAEPLPLGSFFWRATARSQSGLDGFPGGARPLTVTGAQTGAAEPPSARLALRGLQAAVGDAFFTDAKAAVVLDAADPAVWRLEVDGRPAAAWPAVWTAGAHTVAAVAEDPCGGSVRTAPLTFQVDAEPPVLTWQAGDRTTFAGRLTPEEMVERRGRRRRDESRSAPLAWSTGGVRWFALATSGAPRADGALDEVAIASDLPRLFLRARRLAMSAESAEGKAVPPGDETLLLIEAQDAASRVEQMTLRTRATPRGLVIEVEAVDLVGNRSRQEWLVSGESKGPKGPK